MSNQPIVICDLDGTLSSASWRLPFVKNKDWKGFYDRIPFDRPNQEVLRFLHSRDAAGGKTIYLTGRPEDYRDITSDWLRRHGLRDSPLLMRRSGDFRPDYVVKEEILDTKLKSMEVELVIEDRTNVIAMWKRRGFRVWEIRDPGHDPYPTPYTLQDKT